MNSRNYRTGLVALLLAASLAGCEEEKVELRPEGTFRGQLDGSSSLMDGRVTGAEGGVTTTTGDATSADAAIIVREGGMVYCGSEHCECANGIDDDNDGTIDGLDSECTGPSDHDEGSFATGIPGDNRDPNCQDCFFDGNSGSGDDGCRYATSCLTDGTPTSGNGVCNTCQVTQGCIDFCRPATPNGCDCFGCCEIQLPGGGTRDVRLGGACSIEMIDDENACPACVPSTQCMNECGRCELCPGRTMADLPVDCFVLPDAGTAHGGAPFDAGVPVGPRCDNGEQPCDVSRACPDGFACTLGCCLPLLF